MTNQDIKDRIFHILSDVMHMDIEGIDANSPFCQHQGIYTLDVLELLEDIDEEFGTNLFENRDIELVGVSIEDLVTLVEQELNRLKHGTI